MNNIYIDASRNGYSPDQCGKTMTAGELIEYLSCFDPNSPVYLRHDRGYTYGAITEWDIAEEEEEEDI